MRIVVDTNVLVSAALKRDSVPALALLEASRVGVLLKSVATETQFFDVMARPAIARLIRPDTRQWLSETIARAEFVGIAERISICRDPTDDKFLEVAVNGGADAIVTGDKGLLVLHGYRGLNIVSPRAFLGMP